MKILTRLSVLLLVFVSYSSLAQDCEGPRVKFGEVMSGLQAGFTAGTVVINNDNNGDPLPLPSGLFLASSGMDTRGFIDPESGSGWLCSSDWGLVSAWFGAAVRNSRTRQDARALVSGGVIQILTIEVDGVALEIIGTNTKAGTLPNNLGEGAIRSWGAFLRPGSLVPDIHWADIFVGFDADCFPLPGNPGGLPPGECDGIPDAIFVLSTSFEVIAD